MASISVCCIAKNEERFLPEMISSVKDLASEILVLDTGSNDSTSEVARDMGAAVYTMPWGEDFSAARNGIMAEAKGDWILMLDADEVIESKFHNAIEQAVKEKKTHAYRCTILNVLPHPVITSLLPAPSIRLFRNNPKIKYENRVNESIALALRRLTWSPATANFEIRHNGYTNARNIRRLRNRRVFESELKNDPTNAWIRLHLGLHYFLTKEYDQAEEYITQTLKSQSSEILSEARSILLAILAEIFKGQDKDIQARAQALKAIQMGGNVFATYILAQMDDEDDRPENAIKRYLEVDSDSVSQKYFQVHKGELATAIIKCYLKMKEFDMALQYAELAKESEPSYSTMFIGGYLFEQRRDFHRALEFYEVAKSLDPGNLDLQKRMRACRVSLGQA